MNNPLFMMTYLIIQWLVLGLLSLSGLYIFIYSVAGLFYRQPAYPEPAALRRIAVLIPGYKEDAVILEVAEDALLQDYPSSKYDVVIIADSFQAETLTKLRRLPVKVIEVSFDISTKSKALNKAMQELGDNYDVAVILDADNLMEQHFLTRINSAFERGFIAIQGHRTAKNTDTSLAVLDAISEEINNHIFRKGHRVLGLSSAIIGSGMAFRYGYFKELMASARAVGGFDKEIELRMLSQGHTIEYLDDALVYDEKVQKAEVFSNQRKRWLSAQFHYFRQDFGAALRSLLLKGNLDYFDKALQFIQPPRVLLLGAVIFCGLFFSTLNLFLHVSLLMNAYWIFSIALVFLALAFAVPASFHKTETIKALAGLPGAMFLMLKTLLHLKGANKKFIHTQHTSTRKATVNNG